MTAIVEPHQPVVLLEPPSRSAKPPPVDEVPGPASLAHGLPAIYRDPQALPGNPDGSFVRRLTAGLDEVLEPVIVTLDNLPAHFDPLTAPEHFLDWLAGWVGLELYEKWSPKLRRTLIASTVERHHKRGTKAGLEQVVAIFTEAERVTVEESGGVWELMVPPLDDGSIPESPSGIGSGSWIRITVAIGEKNHADTAKIDAVTQLVQRVAERVKPAHVVLREVVVVP
jgi:phage tail-like protein